MYERKYKHENLQKLNPIVTGKYDIPIIFPSQSKFTEFIGFNYAKTAKNRQEKAVHFFLDDYQFERVWTFPEQYVKMLKEYACVLSPDFSLYTDFPVIMQMYNHYRKHWLAQFWQLQGVEVIPTICWSDKSSFDWCFDGEPERSAVAVSSVGTQKDTATKKAFKYGYDAMCERLQPTSIFFYGNIPNNCRGNVIHIKSFQDKWREAKTDDFN